MSKRVTYLADFTADDWELVNSNNRRDIAESLNTKFNLLTNRYPMVNGANKKIVRERMSNILWDYKQYFTASITEVEDLLEFILVEAYG